jgi:hypothetical protein
MGRVSRVRKEEPRGTVDPLGAGIALAPTRVQRVSAHLAARPGIAHCVLCLASATGLTPDAVRAASMIVRGAPHVREADGACALCGKTRLVFTFLRPPRR